MLLQINDINYDYNYDNNINKINNKIIDKPHQSKLNRLENRIEINKILSDTISLSQDVDNDINIICNESARRLSEILKN
jgi:hypothetical protein